MLTGRTGFGNSPRTPAVAVLLDNMSVPAACRAVILMAEWTLLPTDWAHTFVPVFACLVPQPRLFLSAFDLPYLACTPAIAVLLDDMSVPAACRTVIVVAGWTLLPADRPHTFESGFAGPIAQAGILLPCLLTDRNFADASFLTFLPANFLPASTVIGTFWRLFQCKLLKSRVAMLRKAQNA